MSVIEDRGSYITYSAADWREAEGVMPPFLIEGVWAKDLTNIYGQSEAGKSMVIAGGVAALVRGDSHYLGRAVEAQDWRVGIVVGDFGDGARYCERLEKAGLEPDEMAKVKIFDPGRKGLPFYGWIPELLPDFTKLGLNVMVADSMSLFADGDINNSAPCQDWFNAMSHFTGKGIAVVSVTHSTEKFSQGGAQDFMGHSSIKQRPAWHCRIRKPDEHRKTLWFHGNGGGQHEISVYQADPGIPLFDVISASGSDELEEARGKRVRQRTESRKDRDRAMGDWIYRNCQGLNRNESAAKAHAEFPKLAEATIKSGLSRGTYRIRLSVNGHGWDRSA